MASFSECCISRTNEEKLGERKYHVIANLQSSGFSCFLFLGCLADSFVYIVLFLFCTLPSFLILPMLWCRHLLANMRSWDATSKTIWIRIRIWSTVDMVWYVGVQSNFWVDSMLTGGCLGSRIRRTRRTLHSMPCGYSKPHLRPQTEFINLS